MAAGAPEEVERFCSVEYPRLVGMLDLYLGDLHVAEELAQEALLRACRWWEHVGRLDSPGGWTYRVAINLANSHFRRRLAERRAHDRLGQRATEPHHDPDTADQQVVRNAVSALPRKQREALVLRYYLGLTSAEAAVQTGSTPEAIRKLTSRAVATLRDELGPSSLPARDQEASDVS